MGSESLQLITERLARARSAGERERADATYLALGEDCADGYGHLHPPCIRKHEMKDLTDLLRRLQQAQRDLILAVAKSAMMPSDGTLRKISDLENTIAAVEAVLQEERAKARPPQQAA